jgi:hypothetical protein
MAHSVIPPAEEGKIKEVFTQPVSPLRPEHLQGAVNAEDGEGVKLYPLVEPERSLREYTERGIEVRLTRANFRTGRLEISGYVSLKDFVRFLQKQAWRLQVDVPEKIPLGSFRIQVPGNPNAINAALCSGRFPGVFTPYSILDIYPANDPENTLLRSLLSGWLKDPQVEESADLKTSGPGAAVTRGAGRLGRLIPAGGKMPACSRSFPRKAILSWTGVRSITHPLTARSISCVSGPS